MAHPIESTVLEEDDYNKLVKALENPKPNPQAKEMYLKGKAIHKKYYLK